MGTIHYLRSAKAEFDLAASVSHDLVRYRQAVERAQRARLFALCSILCVVAYLVGYAMGAP